MVDLTSEERGVLTRRVMALLGDWRLPGADIRRILNLPPGAGVPLLAAQGDGEPLPDVPEVMRRVGYLVRIEDALHTYFPRNPEMRSLWVRKGNRQFGKRTPLSLMVEEGERGMVLVLAYLDCTFAWDMTGSKTECGGGLPRG